MREESILFGNVLCFALASFAKPNGKEVLQSWGIFCTLLLITNQDKELRSPLYQDGM